jgi:hypothetical protein
MCAGYDIGNGLVKVAEHVHLGAGKSEMKDANKAQIAHYLTLNVP